MTHLLGNYRNLETDFIERTLELIAQYEVRLNEYDFDHQFNHTLLINCLLGLIVLPKEKTISFLPKHRLSDKKLKTEMGITNSTFNEDFVDLKDLIIALRHTIAHFNIEFISSDDDFLIDRILFKDKEKGENYIVASFVPNELLNFIRYYSYWLVHNIREHSKKRAVKKL